MYVSNALFSLLESQPHQTPSDCSSDSDNSVATVPKAANVGDLQQSAIENEQYRLNAALKATSTPARLTTSSKTSSSNRCQHEVDVDDNSGEEMIPIRNLKRLFGK